MSAQIDAVRALMTKASVALFDFDGVVADTERYQLAAYARVLSDFGVELDAEAFLRYIGRSEPEIFALIKRDYRLDFDTRHAIEARLRHFLDNVRDAGLTPYAAIVRLMTDARDRALPVYIVSSNVTSTITSLLDQWGIADLVDAVFASESGLMPAGKLSFLKSLPALLGVSAEACVVFEDSACAISVARGLGMQTVGIRHSLNRGIDLAAHLELDPELAT